MNKLVTIQKNLKVPKNQKNEFGGYNYRSCEDILEAVKPLLSEMDLSLSISDEIVLIGTRYYIKATVTLKDDNNIIGETSAYAREAETVKGQQDAQITGSASSYARKYALNGLFAIDDTKDADSQNNGQGAQEPPKKPAQKAKANNVPFPEVPQETKSAKLLKALNGDKDRYMKAQQWIDERFGEHVNIDDIGDDDFAYLLSKVKK